MPDAFPTVIGISKYRPQGDADPLLRRMLTERGLETAPLLERNSKRHPKPDTSRWRSLADRRDGPVAQSSATPKDIVLFTEEIKKKALALGASDVGCANLTPIMVNQGEKFDYPRVIAIIVAEDYAAILDGAESIEREALEAYNRSAEVATELAAHLRSLGYRALANHVGTHQIQAIPTLYACGLGELGKHGSLIHREFGASFRPGFVLTDALLTLDSPDEFGVQDYCMHCNLCANNCPPAAIPSAETYVMTEGLKRWLTDIELCYMASRLREEYCHICVDVCPYSYKMNNDADKKRIFIDFLGKRRQAGYRAPSWFSEDEDDVMAGEPTTLPLRL